jgi:hypothetical protein
MRLLADENFPKPIVEALRADGHDVLWARADLAGTFLADRRSAPEPTGTVRGR